VAERTPQLRIGRAYRIGGRVVTRLAPGPFRDLDYQAGLTAQVSDATPVLDGEAPTDWVGEISGVFDVPVAVTSHGPTAADKRSAPASPTQPPDKRTLRLAAIA
jgi:adenylosuccinate synthase